VFEVLRGTGTGGRAGTARPLLERTDAASSATVVTGKGSSGDGPFAAAKSFNDELLGFRGALSDGGGGTGGGGRAGGDAAAAGRTQLVSPVV
jgi:hypothetical protein